MIPKYITPKMLIIPIALGGLLTTAVVILVVIFLMRAWFSTPIQVFGFPGPPEQPIAFPHTAHVDIEGINCAFCHRNVTKGDAATILPVEGCLLCHATIQGEQAPPEVAKVIEHYNTNQPINWKRVHRLPDHVQFSHEPHVRFLTEVQGLPLESACATCHGDVRDMVEVEQVRSLKMGDCVDCHRDNEQFTENTGITDCTTCHY